MPLKFADLTMATAVVVAFNMPRCLYTSFESIPLIWIALWLYPSLEVCFLKIIVFMRHFSKPNCMLLTYPLVRTETNFRLRRQIIVDVKTH